MGLDGMDWDGILVSDPVPIGLWILTVLGLGLGLGLGTLDLGLGLDNMQKVSRYQIKITPRAEVGGCGSIDQRAIQIFNADIL